MASSPVGCRGMTDSCDRWEGGGGEVVWVQVVWVHGWVGTRGVEGTSRRGREGGQGVGVGWREGRV